MKTVPTWLARACAMIACGLPPLDWLTYQIHIAVPSKAVPVAAPAGVWPRGAALTVIGPTEFERR